MLPFFSVVIPAFNRFELLLQAIQSVQKQTFQDFEIIVVDDGSFEPIEVPLADDEARIRVFRHAKNLGAAAARNTGIQAANGTLIAFLDSDDLWLPEKLMRQAELMKIESEIGACVCSYHYETEEGYSLQKIKKPASWLKELAKGCRLSPGSTLVVRRECYAQTGYYDLSFPRHEDYDWLLRFIRRNDLGVIEEPLAIVRRGGPPPANAGEIANKQMVGKHRAEYMRLGTFRGKQAVGIRWLETSIQFFDEGDRKKGCHYFKKALLENPIQNPIWYFRVLDQVLGTSMYRFIKRLWLRARWTQWR
jgi:glycosyltransferase involved in cell wall biosynthesis